MKYRIAMSVAIEATSDQQAYELAKKLKELLKSPLLRMHLASEGVQLSGDGRPIVHRPEREVA